MSLQEELFLVRLVGGSSDGSGQLFPTANLHPPAQAHCSALPHSGGIFSVFPSRYSLWVGACHG